MRKFKSVLCLLLAVVFCCVLIGCEPISPEEGNKPGTPDSGDKPFVPPPVSDNSLERLTDYVESTLFYELANVGTVSATTSELAYTAYKDGEFIYGKETLTGSNNSFYSKGGYLLYDSDGEYSLGEIDNILCSSLALLPLHISSDMYQGADEVQVVYASKRTDRYILNADKSKTLIFEYEVNSYFVKTIFTFSSSERLDRIEMLSFGKGKTIDVAFAYGQAAPQTPSAVREIEILADDLSYNILRAKNIASLFAKGKTSQIGNFKLSFNNTRNINSYINEENMVVEKNGSNYSANFTFKSGNETASLLSVYSDSKTLFINNDNKINLFSVAIPSIEVYSIDANFILQIQTNVVFSKKVSGLTKQTLLGVDTYTYKDSKTEIQIKFDSKGRLTDYSSSETEATTTYNIEYDYESTVGIPSRFKDISMSDEDMARMKYQEIMYASSGKALISAGGLKITDGLSTSIRLSFDSEMHATGDVISNGSVTDYIYGINTAKADLTMTSTIYEDFLAYCNPIDGFNVKKLANKIQLYDNENKLFAEIEFDSNNRITKFVDKVNSKELTYSFEAVSKIAVPENVINYLNSL